MKFRWYFLLTITLIVLTNCKDSKLIELSYEEYQEKINKRELTDAKDLIIKDEHGNLISLDSMIILHEKHDYFDKFYKNKQGEIVVYQLSPKPKFRDLSINCDETDGLLDSLLLADQSIRNYHDPKQDYANLEVAINILEKCGMPKEPKSVKTIFLVIQHNHSNHQRKYIEKFREAANSGILPKSSLAMMEDRILMSQNKPQLYGTQVKRNSKDGRWELYKLHEPEKVNKRRSEMGLGSLEEYLKNFDIDFEINEVKQ